MSTTSLTPSLLLIQYRTLHYPNDPDLRHYSYYLESTQPEDPLVKVIKHAMYSIEGEQWRLVRWSGNEEDLVYPLTSWNKCKLIRPSETGSTSTPSTHS